MDEGGSPERHFQRGREREREAVPLSDGTAGDDARGKAVESWIKLKVKMESQRKTSETRACCQTWLKGVKKVGICMANTEELPLFLILNISLTNFAENITWSISSSIVLSIPQDKTEDPGAYELTPNSLIPYETQLWEHTVGCCCVACFNVLSDLGSHKNVIHYTVKTDNNTKHITYYKHINSVI